MKKRALTPILVLVLFAGLLAGPLSPLTSQVQAKSKYEQPKGGMTEGDPESYDHKPKKIPAGKGISTAQVEKAPSWWARFLSLFRALASAVLQGIH